ncbi:UvrD-helicase domain-containing protein [Metabacillus sp. KIGAM252]|uniref:UvrD-helicase domain-containing protein n=1 Tax=Metabacillus flavus TaxID=2823519 RepID=A0ABS5LDX9_9BACI|nr:UvrD-helicase domain-containing protein [Metabacillus flavus]MBS2968733.1 UvrD-helicase domain-containing protein [Metabacillus flavus]
MEKNVQSAFQFESQQLKKFAAEIDRQLIRLHSVPRYRGDDLTEQALEDSRERNRENLAIAEKEPYFGRLDFKEAGQEEAAPLYIGKAGVSEGESGEAMIIDWRAPVASLFYSFTGGEDEVWYMAPEGMIEGDIFLKRNLVIRDRNLQRVVDTYEQGKENAGAADEFLLYRLGDRKDNRLRDIVSTIQAEQNDMIRASRDTALIIQGVAGSGKTTVALHRLAFLLYEYREKMLAEQMIIFAPNAMFLDYISNVLPELGVGDIQQTTFSKWALLKLGGRLKEKPADWQQWFEPGLKRTESGSAEPGRVKGSLDYMNAIDEALQLFIRNGMPQKDFEPWNGMVLKQKVIQKWYIEDFREYPAVKIRELISAKIKQWISKELDKIWEKKVQKEMKTKAGQRFRAYMKTWPELDVLAVYRQLLSAESVRERLSDEIVQQTFKNLKKKEAAHEDLAPLMHIHLTLNGLEKGERYHHIVIDEAQDFSPYQIAVLQKLSLKNSFTILGDLSQGIHSNVGINAWEEIMPVFSNGKLACRELERSYRTTMEIIEFANRVLSAAYKPAVLAKPVFRTGEGVTVTQEDDPIAFIKNWIAERKAASASSLAIVCRTARDGEEFFTKLHENGVDVHLVREGQEGYQGGISIIPVYLTKGLEFDAVLIVDADAENYQQTASDAKLLYVGCTRALHSLTLIYSKHASPLITA